MRNLNAARVARFFWRVESIAYLVFTAIGLALVYVLGGIGFNAVRNGSLLPPPARLERFDCQAAVGNFQLYYLHGSDRVQIKSSNGLLDGTLKQGRADWQGFGDDRSLLGFAPPAQVVLTDAKTLRLSGVDLDQVVCTSVAEAVSQRRAIVP